MLKMMKHRKQFQKYRMQVNRTVLADGTMALLKDFERYFATFPEHETIDFQLFIPRMHSWNKAVAEEVMATRIVTIKNIAKGDISKDVENALQNEIASAVLSTELSSLIDQHAEGDIDNLGFAIGNAYDAYRKNAGTVAEDFITDRIATLLEEEDDLGGYEWRLDCLKTSSLVYRHVLLLLLLDHYYIQ